MAANSTKVERASDRELVVTRMFDAPVALVFRAWSQAALFRQWWVPASCGLTLLSCEMDVRTGGTYRLVFAHPETKAPMRFHGRYIEVVANAKMVWTNEEGGDEGGEGAGAVTTALFAETDGKTLVTLRDLYPTKEALDEAVASGATSGFPEQFAQLDQILAK